MKKLNLQTLEDIMNEFGAEPRIFNSEAQFQFELAWKIKEKFHCEVKLEELSRISSSGKKDYTDIILEKDGLRIALELKYKTAKYKDEYKNIFLKSHGATDLGAYDFLWDVHRIQLLTKMETSDKGEVKRPCDRGYAIILTNDSHYWTDATIKETINRDFLIGGDENGRGVLSKKLHQWYTVEGKIGYSKTLQNNPSRQLGIDLKQNYYFQWKSYHTIETNEAYNEFRYMIVEVAPKGTTKNNPYVINSMKNAIVVEIAKHIEKKYNYHWKKCVDLAMAASWWQKDYTIEDLETLDIDCLVAEVFKHINNGKI